MEIIARLLERIKTVLADAFVGNEITMAELIVSSGITVILCMYIFFIYRISNKTGFYSKSFNKTVAIMGVITNAIVSSMQTSVFISLGMVGALSIIRFRNVVKEPFDLLFLFWSISTGIICGTGLFGSAIILAGVVTLCLFVLEFASMPKAPCLLIVNSTDPAAEQALMPLIAKYSKWHRIKSRCLTEQGFDMIVEVRPTADRELTRDCAAVPGVKHVSLLGHDGELRV